GEGTRSERGRQDETDCAFHENAWSKGHNAARGVREEAGAAFQANDDGRQIVGACGPVETAVDMQRASAARKTTLVLVRSSIAWRRSQETSCCIAPPIRHPDASSSGYPRH